MEQFRGVFGRNRVAAASAASTSVGIVGIWTARRRRCGGKKIISFFLFSKKKILRRVISVVSVGGGRSGMGRGRSLTCVLNVFAHRSVASEWWATGADNCRYTVAERTRTIVYTRYTCKRGGGGEINLCSAAVSTVPGCARKHRIPFYLFSLVRASVYAEFNTVYCVTRHRGHWVRGHRWRWLVVGARGREGRVTAAATTRAQLLYPHAARRLRHSALATASNKWFAQQCARRATTDPNTQCYVLFMRYNYIMIIIILLPCFTPLGVANRRSNYYYYYIFLHYYLSYTIVKVSGVLYINLISRYNVIKK